jgi:hypothetical protein
LRLIVCESNLILFLDSLQLGYFYSTAVELTMVAMSFLKALFIGLILPESSEKKISKFAKVV